MSWLSGYNKPKPAAENQREEKRLKLEAERKGRLDRAKLRASRQKQLQAAIKAREEAEEAFQELLNIDPDILTGAGDEILTDEQIEELLEIDNMADFESENGTDGEKAMDKLGAVKCDFDKADIEFWFSELEGQLEVIEVKAQWTKRTALQRFLPMEIKNEVKSLLKLTKTQSGDDIYKRIKAELIDLFGSKPEEAYIKAKGRVMTGKPSQLGKQLIEDLCTCTPKLASKCCCRIIWGMYREALPVVIRNHIAEMEFTKDTYKEIFKKSDQVFDSNQSSQPVRGSVSVAAVSNPTQVLPTGEIAATTAQRGRGGRGRGRGGNRGGGRGGATGSTSATNAASAASNNQTTPSTSTTSNKGPRHATARGDNEKLCKIHYKWGANGTFCAAPWKCPMKDVYKAPQ